MHSNMFMEKIYEQLVNVRYTIWKTTKVIKLFREMKDDNNLLFRKIMNHLTG